MPKPIHWTDNLRDSGGPSFFEVPGQTAPVPAKPQLPSIICGPATCARLAERSVPIAEGIVERGLRFDREKLQSLLAESLADVERYNAQLPKDYTSASALLKRYSGSRYDEPYAGISIQREANLWAAFPYVLPMSEIAAVMARLRPRRLAAFCANALEALDENERVHSPVFASALNAVVGAFDARELAFASLLQSLRPPVLVIHVPDLPLRSLAFASGDATLSEIFSQGRSVGNGLSTSPSRGERSAH